MKRCSHSLILLSALLLSLPLGALDKISFKHLGLKDGLSDCQVLSMTKDSKGFMWFCTQFGLNRYDGYSFVSFTHDDADPLSLPDNSLSEVREDTQGLLWLRQDHLGYVCFDPSKELFVDVREVLETRYGQSGIPTLVHLDRDGNIWTIEGRTLTRYGANDRTVRTIPVRDNVCSLCDDNERGLVFLYTDGSFGKIDRDSCKLLYTNSFLTSSVKEDKWLLFIDSDNRHWIYSKNGGGVRIYSPAQGDWKHLGRPEGLSSDRISDIAQDSEGRIWLATDQGGINIIDRRSSISYLKNDLFDDTSLIQNSVNCLYSDDEGGMWVGCYKRGVSYYNECAIKFRTDYFPQLNYLEDFSPDVNTIREDDKGFLWIGTSNGLLRMDKLTLQRKMYRDQLPGKVIVSSLKSESGDMWFGSYMGGLIRYDGSSFRSYRASDGGLSDDNVWSLAESEDGYIWVGTLSHGLQRLDPRTGEFTSYSKIGEIFHDECVNAIRIGSDRNLYMATPYGISVFNPSTRQYDKVLGNRAHTQSFSHDNVNDLYEDSRGLLWVATAGGLDLFDREADEITSLSKGAALSIMEDDSKNIWVTGMNSIANIMVTRDPESGKYSFSQRRYSEIDGFRDQQFNARSMFKNSDGIIMAGGVRGMTYFSPAELRYNRNTPKVVFTGLQLQGEKIMNVAYSPQIRLKYSQNMFTVSFSSMNYILPEKTRYLYKLEGSGEDWMATEDNKLTFTNLSHGKYNLQVKAVNSDGFAGDAPSGLQIVIAPPLWYSPWAYLVYLMLALGILYLARRQILNNERQKYRLSQVEEEAKKKHEIDDMKLRFFTNISHELRTPLTLIISPLENVIKHSTDEGEKGKLEMVHRNAVRLLNLVNQLLDFRKIDVKGLQLNPIQGDIVDYIRSVSNSFVEYSEKKNLRFFFFSAVEELWMLFDEDKMGKIVMNLLSNAFKFTPEGGRVDLSLDLLPALEERPESFEIKVSDTGVGVPDEYKKLIFERFYQVQPHEGQKAVGSGIGLNLVKEFVSLHGGTVSVHDNVGKGSVFIVTVPVTRATPVEKKPVESPEPQMTEEEIPVKPDGKPLILIVDDNSDFRAFMRDSLSPNYNVRVAEDGAKAWEIIPTLLPDLIVSDVMMPQMDGNELCRRVKTDIRTSHIPLILLTARSAKEQRVEGLESGADDYITKPFDFDILALRIGRLLQLQQKRKESFSGHMDVSPSEITITSLDEKLIKKAIKYVEDNMSRTELSVEELSSELGMSRVHLYKKLLSITGKSPVEFIRIIRLKRAAQYLRESQLTVSEIAYNTGFSNPKYFRKYFKDEFGILPSDYQDKEGK